MKFFLLFFPSVFDLVASRQQDSMATPGNFGGGSTGPGQIFWA
jgi:hypothetical protein